MTGMTYAHRETGSTDDRDGWITSYSAEELEERGLTAEKAFDEDKGRTLLPIIGSEMIETLDALKKKYTVE